MPFDLTFKLQSLLLLQEQELDSGELFSLSPLSSAESTPATSPRLQTTNLPEEHDGLSYIVVPTVPFHPAPSPPSKIYQIRKAIASPSIKKAKQTLKPVRITPAHHKARRIAASRSARSKKRENALNATTAHIYGRESAWGKYMADAETVSTDFVTEKCSVASTGFVGLRDSSKLEREYRIEEVTGEGSKLNFGLIKWGGSTPDRKPIKIVDASGRAIVILAGHPDDPNWPQLQQDGVDALESRRSRCQPPRKKKGARKSKNRRRAFTTLRCGVSHGGGQEKPRNLTNDKCNEEVLEELSTLKPFKRLAGFASSVMATWAKDLHTYYRTTADKLYQNHPYLRRVFPGSIFCACSYNFGPRTVCYKHRDSANLPFGFCAVTALGSFDPTKGGHLILWELELVVEFPPGSTILLPSVVVSHLNVAIGPGERRYSFAQYTAGALFRWVENACKTKEEHLATLNSEQRLQYEEENASRWKKGLSMFPVINTSPNVA